MVRDIDRCLLRGEKGDRRSRRRRQERGKRDRGGGGLRKMH